MHFQIYKILHLIHNENYIYIYWELIKRYIYFLAKQNEKMAILICIKDKVVVDKFFLWIYYHN